MDKNISAFLQQKYNFRLLKHANRGIIFFYIKALCAFYYRLNRSEMATVKRAVAAVFPEKTGREAESILRRIYLGTICHYAEKFHNILTPPDRLHEFFSGHFNGAAGLAELRSVLGQGRGALLVSAHFGGIEYLPLFLAFQDLPVSIVAQFTSSSLKNMAQNSADYFGLRIIDPAATRNGMNDIFRNLNSGRIVIILCDEIKKWRPSLQKRFSFLGQVTRLDRMLDVLAKRCAGDRIPVIAAACVRHAQDRYKFVTEYKPGLDTGQEDVPLFIMRRFSELVEAHPDNWYQWKNFFSLPLTN